MAKALAHVLDRLQWYMELCRFLLRENSHLDAHFRSARTLLKSAITSLYQALLEYEMRVVCFSFDHHLMVKAARNLVKFDGWGSELEDIKNLEASVREDSKYYNTQVIVDSLSHIPKATHYLESIESTSKQVLAQQEQNEKAERQTARQINWTPGNNSLP